MTAGHRRWIGLATFLGLVVPMAGAHAQDAAQLPPASWVQHQDPSTLPAYVPKVAPVAPPRVRLGFAGMAIANVTEDQALSLGIGDKAGVLVQGVAPYQPADAAGLRRGDIIIGLQGAPLRSAETLLNAIGDNPPNTSLRLSVERGGQAFETTLITAARPDEAKVKEIIARSPGLATDAPAQR